MTTQRINYQPLHAAFGKARILHIGKRYCDVTPWDRNTLRRARYAFNKHRVEARQFGFFNAHYFAALSVAQAIHGNKPAMIQQVNKAAWEIAK